MHRASRWAYHFITSLECVECRGKQHRRLYSHAGKEVDPRMFTSTELIELIPYMDVWCDNCTPRWSRKANSVARATAKMEAAVLADIKVTAQWQSKYDTETIC